MRQTPINYEIVSQKIKESNLPSVGRATIREIKKLVDQIEQATGSRFVRMEMGIPGLPAAVQGVKAQIEALEHGVASIYPDIQGTPSLKVEISKFVKNFLDIDVNPDGCIPTVGSMQGGFAAFMTVNRMHKDREGTLFLDPGFPVHKQQIKTLGQDCRSFDVYNFRGEKLREKLNEMTADGKVSSILYSNPNNPSWICFTDEELRIIAEIANQKNIVIIEDLAYFAMDFRHDYGKPGVAPYQPTVAKYTDNFILMISSSKAFSYAGERIGMMVISDKLFHTNAPDLTRFYSSADLGHSLVFGALYALSSGTSHSAQYALKAILEAANSGELDFTNQVREYGEKAKIMKELFTSNGFKIVYDTDVDKPIADGFYFTFGYPGYSGEELLGELVYYGISAISLSITGSTRLEGIRACVSLVSRDQFGDLKERLEWFHKDHPIK